MKILLIVAGVAAAVTAIWRALLREGDASPEAAIQSGAVDPQPGWWMN